MEGEKEKRKAPFAASPRNRARQSRSDWQNYPAIREHEHSRPELERRLAVVPLSLSLSLSLFLSLP